jgi:hypothetical protein
VATLAPDAGEEADKEPKSAGKKRGRKPLPAHLPRKRVEHDLPESEKVCRCCQGALHRMGEETSEQLDIIPATVQVLQHVRFKYACRQCDRHGESSQIITSPMPPQPMPGSIASPATAIHPSLQFLAKPHTDHEQGIVTGRAAASGSVADLFFGASNDQFDCLYPRLALVTIIRTFW